jgi:hypothetical protein
VFVTPEEAPPNPVLTQVWLEVHHALETEEAEKQRQIAQREALKAALRAEPAPARVRYAYD